ncbi:unnamed protein product [Diabrotica balteata]|uniref:V-SNARE coiled-coil homology domain-containing protein n=1 Tax=Diabrotica balteata TaxID=107213 RepID=A0A9N9SZE5_DIABA|nr:unnamed protein product [Diabrotica balteata]
MTILKTSLSCLILEIWSAGDTLAPGAGAAGSGGDDGIVGGPRTPQQIAAQRRLQQTQAQVDEVVDIMKTNVEKVLERDQKLSELDDRAVKFMPDKPPTAPAPNIQYIPANQPMPSGGSGGVQDAAGTAQKTG